MNTPLSLFNLYCINRDCTISIFQDCLETNASFDHKYRSGNHYCPLCGERLFSSIDREMDLVMLAATVDTTATISSAPTLARVCSVGQSRAYS